MVTALVYAVALSYMVGQHFTRYGINVPGKLMGLFAAWASVPGISAGIGL